RRVDGLDRRAVLCPHLPEEKILQLFRSDNSALGIRRETVGDLRPWQPQAVFEIRERDAIVGIGSLLDQEADSKLPGDSLVQLIAEVVTEHSHSGVAIGIGAAAVDAVDEINSRYVGIATKATSHNEVPALVADIDSECAALVAERTVAQVFNSRGDERTAVGIQSLRLLGQQSPGDVVRVIH